MSKDHIIGLLNQKLDMTSKSYTLSEETPVISPTMTLFEIVPVLAGLWHSGKPAHI